MTGCLSRWGSPLPGWVCTLGGGRTAQDVEHLNTVLAGALTAILLLSAAGVIWSWRRSGLPFRDWLDSLR